jgi:hypothetical protein
MLLFRIALATTTNGFTLLLVALFLSLTAKQIRSRGCATASRIFLSRIDGPAANLRASHRRGAAGNLFHVIQLKRPNPLVDLLLVIVIGIALILLTNPSEPVQTQFENNLRDIAEQLVKIVKSGLSRSHPLPGRRFHDPTNNNATGGEPSSSPTSNRPESAEIAHSP